MSSSWQSRLDAAIDDNAARLIELRRQLHMQPEPSGEELQTSLQLYQCSHRQEAAGADGAGGVRRGRGEPQPEGAAANRDAGRHRRAADSGRKASALSQLRSRSDARLWSRRAHGHRAGRSFGTRPTGSRRCAALAGHLAGGFSAGRGNERRRPRDDRRRRLKDVDAILSLHVDPTRPAGSIGVRSGVFTASCDMLRITVHGRGGHAARPHESADPIAAAAQLDQHALPIHSSRDR